MNGGLKVVIGLVLSLIILSSSLSSHNIQPHSVHSEAPPGAIPPFYWTNGDYLAYEAKGKYDANGTFIFNLSGRWVYHPYEIGRFAAEIYHHWYNTGDNASLVKFRNQISWMRNNEKTFGNHSIWMYNFTIDARDTAPHWSALANAWIVASLLQSYSLDKNPIDLQIAWRGLISFQATMDDHGVLTHWNGTVWYEEEAKNSSEVLTTPSHILNGMIVAMTGARYVYDYNGSSLAKKLLDEGVFAITTHFREYDTGMWEKYSQINPKASVSYLRLHLYMFNLLANITMNGEIRDIANRTYFMQVLPSLGYSPTGISATNTFSPILYGPNRTVDKLLYNSYYWSAILPASITYDLGSIKPINFIGQYMVDKDSFPRDYSIYTSNDNATWIRRGLVLNSVDFEKCLLFNDSIMARYVKFGIATNMANTNRVGISEVVITNLTADYLKEAKLSIEDHRFINTDGRLMAQIPTGAAVWIDGIYKPNVGSNNYSLPNGPHYLKLIYNETIINRSVYVNFAQDSYLNVTAGSNGTRSIDPSVMTSIAIQGIHGQGSWYKGPVMIILTASNLPTGLNWTEYSVDNGPWLDYTEPIVTGDNGILSFEYFSTDLNVTEPVRNTTIEIDTRPPMTFVYVESIGGTDEWNSPSVTVSFSAFDATSGIAGIEYCIDAGLWQMYTTDFILSTTGINTVYFKSTDNAGNAETVQSTIIKIDAINPSVRITSPMNDSMLRTVEFTLEWIAHDNDSGIAYFDISIDNSDWFTNYNMTSTSYHFTQSDGHVVFLSDGWHTIRVRAHDNAGNTAITEITIKISTNVWGFDGPYSGIYFICIIAGVILVGVLVLSRVGKRKKRGPLNRTKLSG